MTNQTPSASTAAEAVDWLRPSVHPMYARLLCAELRRRGIAPEPMLQGTGLAWEALHTGQAFLSLAQLQRLVTQALAFSGDPALGLTVGLSAELSSHGALGFAAASAHTLGEVLQLGPQTEALRGLVPQLRTAAQVWRLRFPRALLALPTLAPDPEAHRSALQLCAQQLARGQQGSLVQRVRLRLLACEGQFPRVEAMAEWEGVSARTLIRRLGEEGTRYQALLDHTRADLACWLLAQTPLPVEAVAARLGFADPSNFSRSFRRWCGQTPRDYRAQHRPEAVASHRADPRSP